MNRGPALPTARVRASLAAISIAPRTGQASFTLQGLPGRGCPQAPSPPLRALVTTFYTLCSCVPARLAALAWGGLRGAGAHPRGCPLPQRPPSPYLMLVSRSLGSSSQPFFFLSCSRFLPPPLPVSCFPQPSVPKPFQSFRMTIIGKKEYAAFSFNLYFQSQRALQCPSCPPPHAPCPPLDDNQRDLS